MRNYALRRGLLVRRAALHPLGFGLREPGRSSAGATRGRPAFAGRQPIDPERLLPAANSTDFHPCSEPNVKQSLVGLSSWGGRENGRGLD